MSRPIFDPHSTAGVYENPANGYREAVPRLAWLWMLLFGVIYLIVRQLWMHVAIVVALIFAVVLISPMFILVAIPMWVGYAASAPYLLRAHYLRQGWSEIDVWEQEGAEA